MTSILERIESDFKDALRNHRKDEVKTLRLMKSELQYASIDKRSALTDDEIIRILEKMVKKRRDAIRLYQEAGRDDRVQSEKDEIQVIERYLPAAMTPEELVPLIDEVIRETNARGRRDLGRVMGPVMKRLKGRRFDGNLVRSLVEERLAGGESD